jgi:hypothetical protein
MQKIHKQLLEPSKCQVFGLLFRIFPPTMWHEFVRSSRKNAKPDMQSCKHTMVHRGVRLAKMGLTIGMGPCTPKEEPFGHKFFIYFKIL